MDWIEPTGWPNDARRDQLIGDWHLYQRTGGHRTSTDDVITAWYAVHRATSSPARYLDLGCGVGSVLLMVCHNLAPAHAVGVEAQAQSVLLARRTLDELPRHSGKIAVVQEDIRTHVPDAPFDLVTGSPPYFPLGAGVLPDDAQRRACRFEARGGVEIYMTAAARALSPDGKFYLVFQTEGTERVRAAADNAELHITGHAEFLMRTDRPKPFLSVFELAHDATDTVHEHRAAVRDENGALTETYERMRAELRESKRGVIEH